MQRTCTHYLLSRLLPLMIAVGPAGRAEGRRPASGGRWGRFWRSRRAPPTCTGRYAAFSYSMLGVWYRWTQPARAGTPGSGQIRYEGSIPLFDGIGSQRQSAAFNSSSILGTRTYEGFGEVVASSGSMTDEHRFKGDW